MKEREIRANFDEETITVYQAYNELIATSAVKNQKFISPPFKKERMTWIKPSFLWMMYRSGWATKKNQEKVLAIKIYRKGFEWALENSCLSHFDKSMYSSLEKWKFEIKNAPVRIQWDPERNIFLEPLKTRAIQVGLTGIAVEKYIKEWIVEINDITPLCNKINENLVNKTLIQAMNLFPVENIYPLPESIANNIKLS